MPGSERYDMVILGGGLAGLTLAIQLKRARPQTSIVVVEKNQHPLAEAAHKVGEAMGEGAAHYFANVVGMKEHLETQELPKLGLRFFFPAGDNRDITQRVELGLRTPPPVPAYLLDRGRFENALGVEAQRLGATFWDGSKVVEVQLGQDGAQHEVAVQREAGTARLQARWLVDASGRAALLKRRLGLAKPVAHDINAAWFRIGAPIRIDDWSDDPAWQAQAPERIRWLATNHLMGRGYWVWLIPLASGSHSIGICADPRFHPFEEINTFERALDWLQRHEPQLAAQIEARRDLRQDFRVLKHFAFGCTQVYSPDRWALTGEAGVFPDPLFSPGSDFIGNSNTFITDLVVRDLGGEDIAERLETYDYAFLAGFAGILPRFEGQYPMFGNAQVFIAKVVFDVSTYYAFTASLFFRNKYTDLEFLASVLPDIIRSGELTTRMEGFFREWNALDRREWRNDFVDELFDCEFVGALHNDLLVQRGDEELRTRIAENLALAETVAAEMFRKAARLVGGVPDDRPINPYAISLKPEQWESDGLFDEDDAVPHDEGIAAQLEKIWLDRVATA